MASCDDIISIEWLISILFIHEHHHIMCYCFGSVMDNDNDNKNDLLPKLYREKHVINTTHMISSYV